MIRLLHLNLRNHPFLKNVNIPLIDLDEASTSGKPYTSVIIGTNGTGKSQILKIITEVFRIFQSNRDTSDGFFPATKYGFNIAFQFYHNIYEIDSSKLTWGSKKGDRKIFECYKYPSMEIYRQLNPLGNDLQKQRNETIERTFSRDPELAGKKRNFAVVPKEIELPNKILASAIMLNDRFTFSESKSIDFYQYLGPRRAANALSTMGFIKKVVRFLFDASTNETFRSQLGSVLTTLGFRKSFVVKYYPVYKKQIYQKHQFSVDDLHEFFTNWRENDSIRRNKDRDLWGYGHYKSIQDEPEKLHGIVRLIQHIAVKAELFTKERKAKFFEVDVFDDNDWTLLYNLEELIKLDLIHLENVLISRNTEDHYQLQEISSGEYNILFSMLAMFSRIEKDSIVLIDEPEISLHPNWQMGYVDQLKDIFTDYYSCHFIIASHSHFIVSDLEGESSSVTSLRLLKEVKRNQRLSADLIRANTYGWAAEEVLYNVFNVRTTRNHYLEYDLRKVISMINNNSTDFEEIKRIYEKVVELSLDDADPLKLIIEKIHNYLARNNA